MKKVVLFTSSQIAWNLVYYLIETKRLSAVIVTSNNHPQFVQMINFLQQSNIPVFQHPDKIKDDFLKLMESLNPSLALCFSYSKIFTKEIIEVFKDRIFNIHPSSLPKYKGPNPLYWQIRDGVDKGAISIHKITQDIDNGDIAYRFDFDIKKESTLGALGNKVSILIPSVVHEFLLEFENSRLNYLKQEDSKYYHNPKDLDFMIDWKKDTSFEIIQKVKASNPIYGGVQTSIKNNSIKILECTSVDKQTYGVKEGVVVLIDENEGLVVSCRDGAIKLNIISTIDGIFSGYSYANFIKIFSGEKFI
ncbi:methionyl-tRNA formyltransferase [Campylobacterota bacterium DY0563]